MCDPFALFLKPMHPALRVLSLADAAAGARLADFLLVDKKLAECFEQDIVQRYAEDPGAVPDWKAALSPGGDALFDRLVSRYAAIASAWLAPGLQQAAPLQYDAGDAFVKRHHCNTTLAMPLMDDWIIGCSPLSSQRRRMECHCPVERVAEWRPYRGGAALSRSPLLLEC